MRNRNHKYRECDGSYTVEAALVFPIIFFVILFLLNYTFYSYDRAKLQAEMNDIARKAGAYMTYEVGLEDNRVNRVSVVLKNTFWVFFGNRQPKEDILKQYMRDRLKSGYYVLNVQDVEVSSTYSNVTVAGIVRTKFYGMNWMNRFFDDSFTFVFSHTTKSFPREEKARALQAAISLGTKIKGIEQALNELAKFIGYIH